MDIFKVEDVVHYAKMMNGDAVRMEVAVNALGDTLVAETTERAALIEALCELLDKEQIDKILEIKDHKIKEYFGRFTSDEMKDSIAKAGFGGTAMESQAVVVDADFAEEAIEYGFDVFGLRNGEQKLLNHHGEASRADSEGYVLVVTAYVCEAMNRIIDDDEEYLKKYNTDDEDYSKEVLWSLFR